MYNTEDQLANLCDMRKGIIKGLSLMVYVLTELQTQETEDVN